MDGRTVRQTEPTCCHSAQLFYSSIEKDTMYLFSKFFTSTSSRRALPEESKDQVCCENYYQEDNITLRESASSVKWNRMRAARLFGSVCLLHQTPLPWMLPRPPLQRVTTQQSAFESLKVRSAALIGIERMSLTGRRTLIRSSTRRPLTARLQSSTVYAIMS